MDRIRNRKIYTMLYVHLKNLWKDKPEINNTGCLLEEGRNCVDGYIDGREYAILYFFMIEPLEYFTFSKTVNGIFFF